MDFLKNFIENFALNNPVLFMITFTSISAFGGFWGSWKTIDSLNNNFGTISGKIELQDNSSPANVNLSFFLAEKFIKTITPNQDGNFTIKLAQGNYSLIAKSQGFEDIKIHTIYSLNGNHVLDKLYLKMKPLTNVRLQVLDKEGHPYQNKKLSLFKKNLGGGGTNIFFTTDKMGVAEIDELKYADYKIIIADNSSDNEYFLWAKNHDYVGRLKIKAGQTEYQIVFPKVVYSELAEASNIPAFKATDELFFAQSFSIKKTLKFSGMGFGVGYGINQNNPSSLEIRKELSENNSKIRTNNIFFAGAISKPSEAAFGDFKKTIILEPGEYWAVAYFNKVPNLLNIVGGIRHNNQTNNFMSSVEGDNWKEVSLNGALADLYFVQ